VLVCCVDANTVYQWMKRDELPEAIKWRILHVYGDEIVSAEDMKLPRLDKAE